MKKIIHTIAGVILSWFAFMVISAVVHFVLLLTDIINPVPVNPKLEFVLRNLLSPGVGGFFAIVLTARWLKYANLKAVAVISLIPIVLIFIVAPLIVIPYGLYSDEWTFYWGEQLLYIGVGIAAIIGVVIALGIQKEESVQEKMSETGKHNDPELF